jgi:hypothetical protein
MGTQKYPAFAQMQDAEKSCGHPLCGLPAYPALPRHIWVICKQEIILRNEAVGMQRNCSAGSYAEHVMPEQISEFLCAAS